ncbi:hypothetical protein Dda_3397 [Drechslerella dactyloides]|uniref:Uncharacterized protein n=1 Tax=Drechslerella dactyloides TaxID=74499 RepID=A0AAD6NKB0_DREDA|nr:hypothetical protein Dda_3397 [Drechslerella dactyloides]
MRLYVFNQKTVEEVRQEINGQYNLSATITAYQSHPHFPLLRGLIYQISNDLIYVKRDILKLLHQVDRYNIREGLKKLLSNDSTTILAVCEVLIPWVYLRGDYEMLQSIRKSHPGIVIRLYDIILEFYERHLHDLWNVSDSERDIVPSEEEFSRRAMGDLYKLGEAPASALEGFILLNICKLAKQGLFVFFELWNPNEFSPASLEGGRRSFRRFLEAQHRFHVPSDSPLQTDDLGELQSLIDVGFTSRMSTLLLMAILRNEMGKTLIFLKQLKPELHSAIEQAQYPKHTWELFSFPYFYRIILDAGVELSYVGHEHKPPAPASESSINWEDVSNIKAADKFLHSIPYINPEISDYVIQTLRWRYPLRPEEGFLLVVDSNNITAPPEDRLYNFNIPMKHNIRALTKFLGLGLDLNGSNLWKKTTCWHSSSRLIQAASLWLWKRRRKRSHAINISPILSAIGNRRLRLKQLQEPILAGWN